MLHYAEAVGFFRDGDEVIAAANYSKDPHAASLFEFKKVTSYDSEILLSRDLDPLIIPSRTKRSWKESESFTEEDLRETNLRLNLLDDGLWTPKFDRYGIEKVEIKVRLTPYELYQMHYEDVFYIPSMLSTGMEKDPNCVIVVHNVQAFSVQLSSVTLPPFIKMKFLGAKMEGELCVVELKLTDLPIEEKPELSSYDEWIRRRGRIPADKRNEGVTMYLNYLSLVKSKR